MDNKINKKIKFEEGGPMDLKKKTGHSIMKMSTGHSVALGTQSPGHSVAGHCVAGHSVAAPTILNV